MKKEVKRDKRRLVKAYWSSITAMCSLVLMGTPGLRRVRRDNLGQVFEPSCRTCTGSSWPCSTIVAVTVAAVALIVRHGVPQPAGGGRGHELAKADSYNLDSAQLAGLYRGVPAAPDRRRAVHRRLTEVKRARLDIRGHHRLGCGHRLVHHGRHIRAVPERPRHGHDGDGGVLPLRLRGLRRHAVYGLGAAFPHLRVAALPRVRRSHN